MQLSRRRKAGLCVQLSTPGSPSPRSALTPREFEVAKGYLPDGSSVSKARFVLDVNASLFQAYCRWDVVRVLKLKLGQFRMIVLVV